MSFNKCIHLSNQHPNQDIGHLHQPGKLSLAHLGQPSSPSRSNYYCNFYPHRWWWWWWWWLFLPDLDGIIQSGFIVSGFFFFFSQCNAFEIQPWLAWVFFKLLKVFTMYSQLWESEFILIIFNFVWCVNKFDKWTKWGLKKEIIQLIKVGARIQTRLLFAESYLPASIIVSWSLPINYTTSIFSSPLAFLFPSLYNNA